MNKTILMIAVLVLLTLFSSAYYSAPADSRIGYKAPALVLGNSNGLSPLQQHRGENVLLTFWASDDASSRLQNMRYDRLSRAHAGHYTHVSVNMDRSSSVFNSVVNLDNLNRAAQYSAAPECQAEISNNWRLNEGYHTFLLDGSGKIIAIDPDEAALASL